MAIALCVSGFSQFLCAAPATTEPAPLENEVIRLNFPENVELKVFLDYVSERLGLNLIYDDQVVNQRITIRSPVTVPKSSLLGLTESILQSKGLVISEADRETGWRKITAAANLTAAARPIPEGATRPTTRSSTAVTQVFPLRYADATKADQIVKPFLTTPGGNTIALADQHLLIVTDFSSNVARISDLIRLFDQPLRRITTLFMPVKNLDAQQLGQQVTALLAARTAAEGAAGAAPGAGAAANVAVVPEVRTNQLVLIGSDDAVAAAAELVRSVDVPLGLVTRTYHLQSANPERIDKLAKDLIGPTDAKRLYTSTVDKDSNLLIVTTTEPLHDRVAAIKQQLDVPSAAAQQSPIRFYKLENTTAADVLQTIQAIEGENGGSQGWNVEGIIGTGAAPALGVIPPIPGANAPPGSIGPLLPGSAGYSPNPQGQPTTAPSSANGAAAAGGQSRSTVRGRDAIITADPNTNTIIVVAKPDVQRIYEQLIRTLDKRRPQVLVQCTIVTLDTSDNFNFGVEIAGHATIGNSRLITFSSFGLSKVGTGADLGNLTLNPGLGFNGVLIASDVADIVVRALLSTGRADVVSAPKILVNDNTAGQLSSVQEAPFTSVNASSTVATTSFAGYASAGTTITVTPHISEGDFLQLEYTVTLNAFSGDGGNAEAGTPPPRQTNQLQSKVTIPDGSTIIVGGLSRKNSSETIDAVPILGQIPIIEYLFSNRTIKNSTSTLFVFIRPVILRDDKFADLKYFSEADVAAAKIDGDYPKSEPTLIK